MQRWVMFLLWKKLMKSFENQLVLITGGSSGIGLALAKNLASRGSNVWIMARRPQILQTALQEIEKYRINQNQIFGALTADVSDEDQVNRTLDYFLKENGIPDLVINSAGITYPGHFEEIPADAFRQVININYLGMVYVLKKIVPEMIARKSGYIVNISSLAGFGGVYGYSAYGPSKFAVSGLSETLLFELKYYGIKVSVVFPADTETPQLEEDRRMRPDVTEALSSDNASAMSPEKTAELIIKGIHRGQYAITPGFDSTWMYHARHTLSKFGFKVIEWMTDRAVKKANR